MSNNNEKDDNLAVSQVYETLRSPTFLKSLYWDILSGIKEKNTYKFMREIAEGVIDQNMEVLEKLNSNIEADNQLRKTIVAKISVMSYTIDKIFSKILYMKLERVCQEQIVKIVQELKDEGKIPENVWSRFKMNTDTAGSQISTTENTAVKPKPSIPSQQKKVVQIVPSRVGRRRRKVNLNYNLDQDIIKKANSKKEILDDLKKVNGEKFSEEGEDSSKSKKGKIKRKNLEGRFTDNSDAESEISFGRLSPISSVHTSDLSSFDDEISLSSDDEKGKKKKVSLKDALNRYSKNGRSKYSRSKTDANLTKTSESKITKDGAAKSISQAVVFESPGKNGLPKRARKPNSRYSSGNMVCPAVKVKERKKSFVVKTYSKMSPDDFSPQSKKVKVNDDDIYVDVVTITKSINEEKTNDIKTPTKQAETPAKEGKTHLFKPHSANRSLTSRRTAPVTLFST